MELNKERRMWVIIDEETGSLMFKPRAGSCRYSSSIWGGGTMNIVHLEKDVIVCPTVKSVGGKALCLGSNSVIKFSGFDCFECLCPFYLIIRTLLNHADQFL